MKKEIFISIITTLILAYLVFAWQEPTVPPPGGNVYAPLHTGPETQTKRGALILNSDRASSTGLIVYQNLSAPENTREACQYTSWTCDQGQTCPEGMFLAGVERNTSGSLCGSAPRQWYQMRLYCCKL
jgi:hypothetical protein